MEKINDKTSAETPSSPFESLSAKENGIDFELHHLIDLEKAENLEEVLCQAWDRLEDYEAASLTNGANYLDAVYRGYRFFEGHRVVKNFRTEYISGTWSIRQKGAAKIIDMEFPNSRQESFILANLSAHRLILTGADDPDKNLIEFIGHAIINKRLTDDPFSEENNSWRKKPLMFESPEALRKRLKSWIHFFVCYYDFHIESKAGIVNFVGLPTCFKWYAGGIYLLKQNELPQNWIACFYNREQAIEAYEIMSRLLDYSYHWPEAESNWVKQNTAVLKQMENKIDEIEL